MNNTYKNLCKLNLFINKIKKYNNEKELRIPIKKRKVISNK